MPSQGWRNRTGRSSLQPNDTRDATSPEAEVAVADTTEQLAKTRESLPQLETKADDEIKKAGELLNRLISLRKEDLKGTATKLFQGVRHVLDYLGAVAKLHPVAQTVVGALKSVVNLLLQRKENHADIAVVQTTMLQTVYHIRFLSRIQTTVEEGLKAQLTTTFGRMADTIKDFGGFVDTLHTTFWQKTCQVFFAHEHKKKLADFRQRFDQHRKDLDELLNTMTQMRLAVVVYNTEEILQRLQCDDPDVEKAAAVVDENGGPDKARTDPVVVEKVATILHERVTPSTKATLRQSFDELLQQHTARYLKKLESVQDTVVSTVTNAQTTILARLKEGAHNYIEDEEVRGIWEENRWKSTVKCRIFVEGLHEHYQRQFHEYESKFQIPHTDAWTLEFFSRVMYHAAIGDVVDDDGSGYISVSEVNDFISEQRDLPRWTKPQWFAFWACGWYNNNAWYHAHINDLIQQAEQSVRSVHPEQADDTWPMVGTVIGALKQLVLVADVEDFSATVKIPPQLCDLQEDYRRYEEKKIKANLDVLRHYLTDQASIQAALGNSRIELHIMPLLYLLMVKLQDTISQLQKLRRVEEQDLVPVEQLATSCIVVFAAFEDRMNDLLRGWRFEGKDVNMQVERYADGLFRKCYFEAHVYEQAYDVLRTTMFGDEQATVPHYFQPFGCKPRRRQSSVPEDLAREVAALSDRVRMLESRISDPMQAI